MVSSYVWEGGIGSIVILFFLLWFLNRGNQGRVAEDKTEKKEEGEIGREGKEVFKLDIDIYKRCADSYNYLRTIDKLCRKLGLAIETEKKSDSLLNIERALVFLKSSSNPNDSQAIVAVRNIHQYSAIYLSQLLNLLQGLKPSNRVSRFRLWRIRGFASAVYDHLKHIEADVQIRKEIDEDLLRKTHLLEQQLVRKVGNQ